jgi:cytoplasmic iron level regulating protein YaaA (DUF328/UPF0246 family)
MISCFYGNLENTRTIKCVCLGKFGTLKLIGILSKVYTGVLNKIIIGQCSNKNEMLASKFYRGKFFKMVLGKKFTKNYPVF